MRRRTFFGRALLGIAWLASVSSATADDSTIAVDQLRVAQAMAWALEGVEKTEAIGSVRFADAAARPLSDPDVINADMRLANVSVAGEEVPSDGSTPRLFGTLIHESPLGFRAVNDFAARYRKNGKKYVVEDSFAQAHFVDGPRPMFAIVESARVPVSLLQGPYEPNELVAFLEKNAIDPTRKDAEPRDYHVFAVLLDRISHGRGFMVTAASRAERKPKRPDAGSTALARDRWHAAALHASFAMGSGKELHFQASVLDERGKPSIVGIFSNRNVEPLVAGR